MPRNDYSVSEAEFAGLQGWEVGTVLRGDPIVHLNKTIERGVVIRITAIGDFSVLARRYERGVWASEGTFTFTSREWKAVGFFNG